MWTKCGRVPIILSLISIFTLAIFITSEKFGSISNQFLFFNSTTKDPAIPGSQDAETHYNSSNHSQSSSMQAAPPSTLETPPDGFPISVPEWCDLAAGEWVYDNRTRPLYQESQCEYIFQGYKCMDNGREDDTYQKWRWQPNDCSLPKFDAKLLLERLRGKRLVFVGDSIISNQWESMVCMVESIIPAGKKSVQWGNLTIFLAEEYDARLEFYWAPFLVRSNYDKHESLNFDNLIIMADTIPEDTLLWEGADYLIFNTYTWWMKSDKTKVLRGSFDEGSTMYDEIDRPIAYERALRTWAKWLEEKVDPARTSVFFMTSSAQHYGSNYWQGAKGVNCEKETLPVANKTQLLGTEMDERLFDVAKNVTNSVTRVPITFIDMTAMSKLRKDAHTTVNTWRDGKALTPEQKANPAFYADCLHWCLPGLPDTLNELLYARILSR